MGRDVPADLRRYFTTGVAGITTHGRDGPNIMSAEWTFNVSYDPLLLRGASGYHQLGPRSKREPFMYVFAGFRKSEGGISLNVEGRVFGAREGENVLVSMENSQGKRFASQDVTTTDRGYFHTRLEFDSGISQEEYTIKARHHDLTGTSVVQPT